MKSNGRKKRSRVERESDEGSTSSVSGSAQGSQSEGSMAIAAPENFVQRTPQDILCGRGVNVLRHLGNLRLHLLAREFQDEYKVSRRDRKQEIVQTIIHRLKASGSRFLTPSKTDKSKWIDADPKFVYTKVSHVLRGLQQDKTDKGPRSSSIQSQIDPTLAETNHPDASPLIQDPSTPNTQPQSQETLSASPNLPSHNQLSGESGLTAASAVYSSAGCDPSMLQHAMSPSSQPLAASLTYNPHLNVLPNIFLGNFLAGHHQVARNVASLPMQQQPSFMPPFGTTYPFFTSTMASLPLASTAANSAQPQPRPAGNPAARISAAAVQQDVATDPRRAYAASALAALQSSTLSINQNPSVLLQYLQAGSIQPALISQATTTEQRANQSVSTDTSLSSTSGPQIQSDDFSRNQDAKPSPTNTDSQDDSNDA